MFDQRVQGCSAWKILLLGKIEAERKGQGETNQRNGLVKPHCPDTRQQQESKGRKSQLGVP